MNMLIWLMTGALMAWLVSCWRTTLGRQRLLIEAVFAALGGLVGGVLGASSNRWLSSETDWTGLAGAAVGAAVMLGIANLRAGRSHYQD